MNALLEPEIETHPKPVAPRPTREPVPSVMETPVPVTEPIPKPNLRIHWAVRAIAWLLFIGIVGYVALVMVLSSVMAC